jgi:prevent-host-death family protein
MSTEPAAQFSIEYTKTHLPCIIERVERGEEVVISRAGTPVAKIAPLTRAVRRTGRGRLRGTLVLADDWDSPETNRVVTRESGLAS